MKRMPVLVIRSHSKVGQAECKHSFDGHILLITYGHGDTEDCENEAQFVVLSDFFKKSNVHYD